MRRRPRRGPRGARGPPGASATLDRDADGNYDLKGKKMINLADPVAGSDAATKGFAEGLLVNGDGNIDAKGGKVVGMADPTDATDGATKAYVDSLAAPTNEWSSFGVLLTPAVDYSFESEADVEFQDLSVNRKVKKVIDRSPNGRDGVQNTLGNQPSLCTDAERVGGRYYLKFESTTDVIISPFDTRIKNVAIYIVYNVDQFRSTFWSAPLFGNVGNDGHDKFIGFRKAGNNYYVSFSGTNEASGSHWRHVGDSSFPWPSGGDGTVVGAWHVLCISWIEGSSRSSFWVDGVKARNFVAEEWDGAEAISYLGNVRSPGPPAFPGGIARFLAFAGSLSDDSIKGISDALVSIYS